jgi:hypothetical protein
MKELLSSSHVRLKKILFLNFEPFFFLKNCFIHLQDIFKKEFRNGTTTSIKI